MPEFLSVDWVAALDQAARGSRRLAECAAGEPLVLEQRVDLGDGSEHVHHVVLAHGTTRVHSGRAEAADVILLTDLSTARQLAAGTTNAQAALTAGRLRIHGAVHALLARSEQLAALDDVFASVRADTTFPPVSEATVTSPA